MEVLYCTTTKVDIITVLCCIIKFPFFYSKEDLGHSSSFGLGSDFLS